MEERVSREYEKGILKMLKAEMGSLQAELRRTPKRQQERCADLKRLIADKQRQVMDWQDKVNGVA